MMDSPSWQAQVVLPTYSTRSGCVSAIQEKISVAEDWGTAENERTCREYKHQA